MKKLILLLILPFALPAQAQQNDKKAILQVLETQRLAWNQGNLETFMDGYWRSDSLLFVGANGPKYGWQNTLDNYKKGYPDKAAMGILTFDIKEVRILDKNNAFVLGAWHLKRRNDEPKGYFTLLFRRFGNQWKVVADHSS